MWSGVTSPVKIPVSQCPGPGPGPGPGHVWWCPTKLSRPAPPTHTSTGLHWAAPGSGTETQWEIITEIITTDNSLCLQFSSGRWYENIFIRRIDQIDKVRTKLLLSIHAMLVRKEIIGFIFQVKPGPRSRCLKVLRSFTEERGQSWLLSESWRCKKKGNFVQVLLVSCWTIWWWLYCHTVKAMLYGRCRVSRLASLLTVQTRR